MRRACVAWLALFCIALGTWQIGHGAWTYAKAYLAQHLLHRAWERALRGERGPKPWPWADTWPVARLQVPKHGVDLIVLAGATGRTLAFGPAQVSSTDALGEPGTIILTGHRDTHFRFLERLDPGDEIFLQLPRDAWYRYRVVIGDVVEARRARLVNGGREALALVTCYPFDALLPGGSFRYVVTAEHVSFGKPTALR